MSARDKQIGGDHYATMAIQPSEYIHRNGLNWCEGNAIKYITRHKLKGGRQDIEKAIHYLELLLELEYSEPTVEQLKVAAKAMNDNEVPTEGRMVWPESADLKGLL